MGAELKASVSLNTADFQRGLRSLRRTSAQVQSVLASAGQVVGMFAAGGAAIATAYYMTAKRVADYGDAIAKASERTGVGVEQLSALKFAASLADVEFEQLERGIKGMQEALGTKAGLTAFRALGVDVAKFGALKADEQIYALADAFAAVADPVKKTQLAADIFGAKMGTRFLNIFGEGAKKLRQFGKEAADLGLIVKPEQGAAAERFNDNLTRIKGGLMGMAQSATQLGPLSDFMDKIVAAQKALVGSGALERFGSAIAGAAGQFLGIESGVKNLPALLDAVSAKIREMTADDSFRMLAETIGGTVKVAGMAGRAVQGKTALTAGSQPAMAARAAGWAMGGGLMHPGSFIPVVIVGDRTQGPADGGIGGR